MFVDRQTHGEPKGVFLRHACTVSLPDRQFMTIGEKTTPKSSVMVDDRRRVKDSDT
jgi:hypothetical protein